jgi:hypothetical protein
LPTPNPPCATVAGAPHPAERITAGQIVIVIVVCTFTGWLLTRGLPPIAAVLVTTAAVTIAAMVGQPPREIALSLLHRIAKAITASGGAA